MSADQLQFLFLESDLVWLDGEIERIRGLIREAKELGQESTEQSSESWHDNYNFEESQRQLKMFLNMLGGLSKAREFAVVVVPEDEPVCVGVGTHVAFRQQQILPGERLGNRWDDEFSIGSYMVGDALRELDYISYETPIGQALMGAVVGDERRVLIGKEEFLLTVLRVRRSELPEQCE